MRYRRHHSLISAWLRYVPKILSKFVSAIFSFLIGVIFIKKNNFKKAIIRIANGIGYLFGLTNIIIERYKY
jgi:hypothetical protein